MKRDLTKTLSDWAKSKKRKPLILRGARQVGKTWLAREISKEFDFYLEVNFERNPELNVFFKGNFDVLEINRNLSNYFGKKIIPGKTLLFFDEIQNCPQAITALRYYYEELPELHIISAGSLLEFELRKISIPVGRISFIYVYPLSFGEYLDVSGNSSLRKMLLENDQKKLADPFHIKLLNEIRNFTLIGGMPEVVDTFINSGIIENCINIQTDILHTYKTDFNKYAKESLIKYMTSVFNSIPHQSGNKFKYSKVSDTLKSKYLKEALTLLEMAGIAYKVYHSSSNGIPLAAEINRSKFKVLFFDIGLAQRLLKLDYKKVILNPDISKINNGTIAELLVGLEIISNSNHREEPLLHYWHREAKSSNAVIDYIISIDEEIIPIEVKSGSTGRMKSLKIFMSMKKSKLGIKISKSPYSFFENILAIPFYGIEAFIKKSPITK